MPEGSFETKLKNLWEILAISFPKFPCFTEALGLTTATMEQNIRAF
tara:strand:+ start:4428 stop:4565 length:138 start_codon:yes stop_codon:yes gene_type:complete